MSVGAQRLREDADRLRAGAIAKREDPALVDVAIAADTQRRELSAEVDALRAEKKARSAEVGALLAAKAAADDPKVVALKAASAGRSDDFWSLVPDYYRPSAAEEKFPA